MSRSGESADRLVHIEYSLLAAEGSALVRTGRIKEAIELVEKPIKELPDSAWDVRGNLELVLGLSLLMYGDGKKAFPFLKNACQHLRRDG